jgi:general secretion pathway protein I
MPKKAHAHQSGFSLLELMIAVALLSLALIPLLVNQGTSNNNALHMHKKTLAFLVADNMVAENMAAERIRKGRKTGIVKQGGIRFKWQSDIAALPDTSLHAITVKIFDRESGPQLASLIGFHAGQR